MNRWKSNVIFNDLHPLSGLYSFLQLMKYFYLSQFVGEHELAVLGTPNIGPNGTIVTNTIYGMGDDDLLQLPRINRNQITVGKFIGKYSTLSTYRFIRNDGKFPVVMLYVLVS